MSSLVQFMNSTAGRALRVILGLVLIYVGLGVVGGTTGVIVAVIGLVPIVLGLWGRCLVELIAR